MCFAKNRILRTMKKKRGPLVRVYDYDADTLLLFFLCPPTNKLTNETKTTTIPLILLLSSNYFLSLSLSLLFIHQKRRVTTTKPTTKPTSTSTRKVLFSIKRVNGPPPVRVRIRKRKKKKIQFERFKTHNLIIK